MSVGRVWNQGPSVAILPTVLHDGEPEKDSLRQETACAVLLCMCYVSSPVFSQVIFAGKRSVARSFPPGLDDHFDGSLLDEP